MSVATHLDSLASSLVLSNVESTKINTSISTLNTRINSYFGPTVMEHFKFGSSTRGTILPRKADENSDIDYMVVFNTLAVTFKPQTYLDRLKAFSGRCYSTSEIKQSTPTMVLELQHIKFELVPAIKDAFGRYQIPSPATSWRVWMYTNPNGFNTKLTNANINNNSKIKPLARLMKYWNARNGYIFYSFSLEDSIVNHFFLGCSSLKDYFYAYWSSLTIDFNAPQTSKDKLQKGKDAVAKIKQLEANGKAMEAEYETKKFLPSI